MSGVKLTRAQTEALAALATWQEGHWVPTASLNADGVSTATLRSLYTIDLIDAQQTRTTKYWQITPTGRAALSTKTERGE